MPEASSSQDNEGKGEKVPKPGLQTTKSEVFRLKFLPEPKPSTSSTSAPAQSSKDPSPTPPKKSKSSTTTPKTPRTPSKEEIRKMKTKFKEAKCFAPTKELSLLNAVKATYRFIYRINDGVGTTNTILQKVCEDRGWREFKESSLLRPGTTPYERAMRGATGWNLWWSYSIYQFSPYKYLRSWQFTNHNPKGFQFCNKLYLTMYMRKMQAIHGSPYDFYPLSFVVPEDYVRLCAEHTKRAEESFTKYNYNNLLSEKPTHCCSVPVPMTPKTPPPGAYSFLSSPYSSRTRPRTAVARIQSSRPSTAASHYSNSSKHSAPSHPTTPVMYTNPRFVPVWISKPVALSQGKGIFLTTDMDSVLTDKKSVVQEYITRPFLIGGYKWDIRIYVCISAIDPLVIYIYQEGLCRFCTEKYDVKDLSRMYSHLTNASLNKLSPNYEEDKELIGQGCKWSLRQLRQHFSDRKICDWLLWQKVMAMVVLTVLGDALRLGYSASNRNCFDLFGFDVLVDENLKPWLLECNYSPGLGGDSKTDEEVKIPMLHELFDLLGFPDSTCYENTSPPSTPGTPLCITEKVESNHNGCGESKPIIMSALPPERPMTTDDEIVPFDKDDITRHYFDMLLTRLKFTSTDPEERERAKRKALSWTEDPNVKAETRLSDAKSIYSQNLVVQYLKNQSTSTKLSKNVRDQLINVAAKKLRKKLSEIAATNVSQGNFPVRKERKPKPNKNKDRVTESKTKVISSAASTSDEIQKDGDDSSVTSSNVSDVCKAKDMEPPASAPAPAQTLPPPTPPEIIQPSTPVKSKSAFTTSVMQKIRQEFPSPDSEAFQKLKYYFDAGVDYPMDAKTGRFKGCPALISVKKNWFNAPKQEGGWIRVYPFDARTTKSPYKSSLTDIRQAVRAIESYIKVAEHLYLQFPNESDDFFRKKIKAIGRRDTEVWTPPTPIPPQKLRPDSSQSISPSSPDISKPPSVTTVTVEPEVNNNDLTPPSFSPTTPTNSRPTTFASENHAWHPSSEESQ